jgi:hypothetical protein
MGYIAPLFAQYPLGEQYTEWLYGDAQSNPYWDRPDKWSSQSAMVAVQDRTVVKLDLGYTGVIPVPVIEPFNLTGGRNCVVFCRHATVTFSNLALASPNVQAPNQLWAYTAVGQRTVEGYREIDEGTPIVNTFGTEPWPHKFPVPIMWNDRIRRVLSFTYDIAGGENVDITLSWKVAWLNTGA